MSRYMLLQWAIDCHIRGDLEEAKALASQYNCPASIEYVVDSLRMLFTSAYEMHEPTDCDIHKWEAAIWAAIADEILRKESARRDRVAIKERIGLLEFLGKKDGGYTCRLPHAWSLATNLTY
jgi:hypothetical protein